MAKNKYENWRDFTTEEINKIKDDKCMSCPYFVMRKCSIKPHVRSKKRMDYSNSYCNYLGVTGRMRDQRPDECTHYKDQVEVDTHMGIVDRFYDYEEV